MNYKIYGRPDCDYCEASKKLLDNHNRPYQYIDITYYNFEEKEKLKSTYSMSTIPIILNYQDSLIGGFTELQKELEETAGGYGDSF